MSQKILLLTVLLLAFGPVSAGAKGAPALDIGKGPAMVSFLQGSADLLDKGVSRPLLLRDAIVEGNLVRTGANSQLELLLADQSRLRFAGHSEFRVVRMETGGPSAPRDVNIHVSLGRAWANVAKAMGKNGKFSVSCDQAVAGVRGTVYRMVIEPDRSALVRVYDGTVHVSGGGTIRKPEKPSGPPTPVAGPKPVPGPHKVTMEAWTVIIEAMQQVRISADGVPEKPRGFSESEDRDDWVEWNRARDREI
jgi:hypothetical protein